MHALSTRFRITWGLGSLSLALAYGTITNLYLFHAVTALGMDALVAGTLNSAVMILSALWDPAIGRLSDRQHGARVHQPYLLAGALVTGSALALLFALPAALPGTPIFLAAALGAYVIGMSMFGAQYLSIGATLTDAPHERTRLMAYRSVCLQIGASAGAVACPALVSFFGGAPNGFLPMGIVAGTTVAVLLLVTWHGMPNVDPAARRLPSPTIREQLRHLRAHRALQLWLIVTFVRFGATAARASVFLFFLTQVLGRSTSDLAAANLATIATTVASTPLWVKLGEHLSKFRALQLGYLLYALTVLSWGFADTSEADGVLLVRCAAIGVCAGGILLYSSSIMADTLRFVPHGLEGTQPATYAAIYGSAEKLATALGAFVGGVLVSAAGTGEGRGTLLVGVIWIPLAGCLVAIVTAQVLQHRSLLSADTQTLLPTAQRMQRSAPGDR